MGDRVDPPSVYLLNCVAEVERSVLGRDNRKPIHDVIQYLTDGAAGLNTWADDIGLAVENGKLCVVYDPTGASDEPYVIPDYVQTALSGILTDVYGEDVRQDIVTAFEWGAENFGGAAIAEEALGLTVYNGKLCVVYGEDDSEFVIPTNIRNAMNRILTDTEGRQLRSDIVTILRWAMTNQWTRSGGMVGDLGLVVENGKLCIEYLQNDE